MFCFSPPKFVHNSLKPTALLDDATTSIRPTPTLTPITKTRSMPLMRQRKRSQHEGALVLHIDDLITSLSPPSLAEDLADYQPKDVARRLSRRIHIRSRSLSFLKQQQQQQQQQQEVVKPENDQNTNEQIPIIPPPPPPVFKVERIDEEKVIQYTKKEHKSLLTEHYVNTMGRRVS
jgi:hypothetical protein